MGTRSVRASPPPRKPRLRGGVCAGTALAVVFLAGCGGSDFKNEARAPIRLELSGVIQDDAVTVSPAKIGAGPVAITISNQTEAAHSITLEGASTIDRAGPVPPGATATIQKTLTPGSYEVKAGSEKAVKREIRPAVLKIGKSRANSNNDVLLP